MLGRVPGDAERPSGSAAAAAGSGGATAQACPEIDDTDQLKGKKNPKDLLDKTEFRVCSSNFVQVVVSEYA